MTSDKKFMVWGGQKVQAHLQGFISCIWIFVLFFLAIRFYKQAVRLVPYIDSIVEDFRSSYLASGRLVNTFSIVTCLTEFEMMPHVWL